MQNASNGSLHLNIPSNIMQSHPGSAGFVAWHVKQHCVTHRCAKLRKCSSTKDNNLHPPPCWIIGSEKREQGDMQKHYEEPVCFPQVLIQSAEPGDVGILWSNDAQRREPVCREVGQLFIFVDKQSGRCAFR